MLSINDIKQINVVYTQQESDTINSVVSIINAIRSFTNCTTNEIVKDTFQYRDVAPRLAVNILIKLSVNLEYEDIDKLLKSIFCINAEQRFKFMLEAGLEPRRVVAIAKKELGIVTVLRNLQSVRNFETPGDFLEALADW